MAARTDAAASCSTSRCFSFVFLFTCLFVIVKNTQANHSYSRLDILNIGFQCNQVITSEFLESHYIPEEIARTPGSTWTIIGSSKRRRRRRHRKQKRGCRSGLLVRLREQPHKPPLPSVFLTNARSLANKMDELLLQIATNNNMKDC